MNISLRALGLSIFLALPALSPALAAAEAPSTGAYYDEGRSDVAWENDMTAFRVYGPKLKGAEDSGVDCWFKSVSHPILKKWYEGAKKGVSYHEDHGEGHDVYHVGSSRGCGGLALWRDGEMLLSGRFTNWRLMESSPEKTVLKLSYLHRLDGRTIQEEKIITQTLGTPFFQVKAAFTEDGKPVANLPVAIGLTTHDGKAAASSDPQAGWMACWETIQGKAVGTGAIVPPSRVVEMKEIKSQEKDKSHNVCVVETDANGEVEYRAGFAWGGRDPSLTSAEWEQRLKTAAASK